MEVKTRSVSKGTNLCFLDLRQHKIINKKYCRSDSSEKQDPIGVEDVEQCKELEYFLSMAEMATTAFTAANPRASAMAWKPT